MAQTEAEKKTEDWMTSKWRPLMAVTYMATIWFDFIVGPIIFNILQYYNPGQAVTSWTPLTLQGGGLFHVAMGAVLGVSAYGRTQEKLGGATNTSTSVDTPVLSSATPTPAPVVAKAPTPSVTAGFGGKLAPPPAPQPEI